MDALRTAVEVYFLDRDFEEVIKMFLQDLDEGSVKKNFDSESFENLFLARNTMFSTNVVSLMPDYLYSCQNSRNYFGMIPYNILAYLGKKMLKTSGNDPICKYASYLRWNEISSSLGEDLFTIPFLVNEDADKSYHRVSFGWKPVLTTDSTSVNSILAKGLSENHFHLKASSTVFDLNWLSLMNFAINRKKQIFLNSISDRWSLYSMVVKASMLRLYLFLMVNNYEKDFSILERVLSERDSVDLWNDDIQKLLFQVRTMSNIKPCHPSYLDYAIPPVLSNIDRNRIANVHCIGERKLLYDCLVILRNKGHNSSKISLMLYAYLLAKNKFRQSIVQNNKLKGFSNFQKFDSRKDKIIEDTSLYSSKIAYTAVQGTIQNQNITDLELRITPKNTRAQQEFFLHKYNTDIKYSEAGRTNIGYIIHFIKSKDKSKDKNDGVDGMSFCRDQKVRTTVEMQSEAIIRMIKNGSGYIKTNNSQHPQIVGIDAAGSEFFCRAEAFAPAFRKIHGCCRDAWLDLVFDNKHLPLGRTFHVGEDFYDIVDGLRAIEESVLFLNLGNGDRIGHGVAMGIDAFKYYSERHYTLVLPKQCLLDNVAWILTKMDYYSIIDEWGLRGRLDSVFDRIVRELYNRTVSYRQYYDSWLLRGDKPDLNFNGLKDDLHSYDYNDYTMDIRNAHNNKIAQELFISYHYDSNVWIKGKQVEEYKILPSDVKIIAELQKYIRKMIATKEIAVETNPTSNLKITDVRRYADHPILKMNSRELIPGSEELYVSINTDDQGVMATSLEKEFSIMALALEKEVDADGNPVYNRKDILNWLDEVRKMGYERSFLRG